MYSHKVQKQIFIKYSLGYEIFYKKCLLLLWAPLIVTILANRIDKICHTHKFEDISGSYTNSFVHKLLEMERNLWNTDNCLNIIEFQSHCSNFCQ